MKTINPRIVLGEFFQRSCVKALTAAVALTCWAGNAAAVPSLGQATITKLNNDVRFKSGQSPERPAKVQDVIRGSDTIRTGPKSQVELEFPDKTIIRLGSTTVFSFNAEKREFTLKTGALVFDMPKNAGGGKIITPMGTAAIEGTAGLVKLRSPLTVICLAGVITLQDAQGHTLATLSGGQMMIPGVTNTPVSVNLMQLIQVVQLLTNPLPNNNQELLNAINAQQNAAPGSLQNPPGDIDNGSNQALGLTKGQLALKFAAKMGYIGSNPIEAVALLQAHVPPISPPGGWDNLDQSASQNDLTVMIGQQLRLPVDTAAASSSNPDVVYQAYTQAMVDYIGTTDSAVVNASLGTFNPIFIALSPNPPPPMTESQANGGSEGNPRTRISP